LALFGFFLGWSPSLVAIDWTTEEQALLKSLQLDHQPANRPSLSNRYADDQAAVTLGHQLFFDQRLSANGQVSCASCHVPEKLFIDGLSLATGGIATSDRKTMTVIGVSVSPWLFWDGRKDSLWSQALEPWESSVEHGGNRAQYARLIAKHYGDAYQSIFGELPNFDDKARFPLNASPDSPDPSHKAAWETMSAEDQDAISTVFANMGKAVEAYQRQFFPARGRFDTYVDQVFASSGEFSESRSLTEQEEEGLRLFISEQGGRCIQCHNGPLFSNNEFHNTGVPPMAGMSPDRGRAAGVEAVLLDEFNCLSKLSDAEPESCEELRFVKSSGPELEGAMRTPSLRNITRLAPFMHQGQFATLEDVLKHYQDAPQSLIGHTELSPLQLDAQQLASIQAFLSTLDGGVNAPQHLLQTPSLP
jgi:cytochrome c peroxidase|tara:strand:- start:277 stop:1530 length:1254 start_codon:yes stop_codon:yes gene_type:complete